MNDQYAILWFYDGKWILLVSTLTDSWENANEMYQRMIERDPIYAHKLIQIFEHDSYIPA